MRAHIAFCIVVLSTGAVVADDVPPPPDITPNQIFSSSSGDAPIVTGSGSAYSNPTYSYPSSGGSAPVMYPAQQRFFYPGNSSQSEFTFAGYMGGLTTPIDGTVDDLYNTGVQFQIELGRQWQVDDGAIDAFALVIGLANQTYFPADNMNVFDASNGQTYGLGNLSINTFKSGAYVGRTMGNFDCYLGMYTKIGCSYLDEDFEFYTPGHKLVTVQELKKTSVAGGVGVEGAICLAKFDKSSLAFVAGCEYIYIDNFAGQDHWTFFTQSGFQWEFDITDGFTFCGRDRDPRCGRQGRRGRERRCRRW